MSNLSSINLVTINEKKAEWMNWTETEWRQWVYNRLEDRRRVYLIDPDDLISAYNREKRNTRDYHGREILELIQNADDAGIDYGKPNKITIISSNDGLIIANTGVPFSPEGIKSLMISDRSPKQYLRSNCIGHKGLGFRSILGWASVIGILGQEISIQFSEELAREWLLSIRVKESDIDTSLKKFEDENGIENPIPTLGVPSVINREANLSPLFKKGNELLEKGYDTVICLEYKDAENVRNQVKEQINELTNTILLFLQNVTEIEVVSEEKNCVWKVNREQKEKIVLNPEMPDQQHWRVFIRDGEIPLEYLREDQKLENRYEIKIAVSERQKMESRVLNVYFPTEIRFPYPILAHATFELTGNRQNMTKSEANRYISQMLAEAMVEVAEKTKDRAEPWAAFELLSPKGEIDSTLKDLYHFEELLLNKMKETSLIPVRNNRFSTPKEAKRIQGNFDALFFGDQFLDLCIYTPEYHITQQLEKLNVDLITNEEIRKRVNAISATLNIDDRCEIIFRLIKYDHLGKPAPELLVDEEENSITNSSPKFFPPEEVTFSIPSWLPQKIINLRMVKNLKEIFRINTNNELIRKLENFDIQPYSFVSIVSAIVAEGNRQISKRLADEFEIRRKVIQAIWSLYSSSGEQLPQLPERVNLFLPTRSGEYKEAKTLYFGKEYKKGKLLEHLYGEIIPDRFITSPTDLGFADTSEKIEDFLEFLGVAAKPRGETNRVYRSNDFYGMVASSFANIYPLGVEGYSALRSRHELDQCDSALIANIQYIDHFEEMLLKADPHAIICWIALFSEVDRWRTQGDQQAEFWIRPTSRHGIKKVECPTLPSYPLWLLKTIKWLPVESGEKQSPAKCFLSSSAREISSFMGIPAIDPNHYLFKLYNLDPISIKNSLSKVGVITDINDLSWDAFFDILLEHSELDPEGTKAKSLYRSLITKDDNNPPPEGQKYQQYLKNGRVLARRGNKLQFLPINQVYYLDNSTIPEIVAENFPLLELDKKRGPKKVRRMFGVEPLSKESVQIKVNDFVENVFNDRLKQECNELLPYVYALRVFEDSDRTECRKLKNFELKLCKTLLATLEIGENLSEVKPKNGDYIHYENMDYVVYESLELHSLDRVLSDELLADIVGEVITNYLNADISDKIARLATCTPSKRIKLLDKIMGGSCQERLQKSMELLDSEIVLPLVEFGSPVPAIPKQSFFSSIPPKVSEGQLEPSIIPIDQISDYQKDHLGPVIVNQKEHVPTAPKMLLKKRVKLNSKPTPSSPQHKRMDPDLAEDLVIRFEEAEGRFPIKVSHLQGSEGYGCDILSFISKDDVMKFNETNELTSVDRFIEVKGSSRESGAIVLKGNEMNSALKFTNRFYLYRVYQQSYNEKFDIMILNNPTNSKEATEIQYEVNPFRAKGSLYFVVEEVDEEDNEMQQRETDLNP